MSRKCRRKANNNRKYAENKPAAKNRKLVLIDIENYLGNSRFAQADVVRAREFLCSEMGIGADDIVVIGTSHTNNFMAASLAWKGPRHVGKWGHNGADMALIEAIREYELDSFAEICFVSGDGIFAETVEKLCRGGYNVHVMYGRGAVSHKLAGHAKCVVCS